MHYKLRIRSTVGRTNQTVYAPGDVISAGGIDWTVADASDAVLRGRTAKDASVELADWGRAIHVTIDGVEVGTFDRSREVGDTRLAVFLDAVVSGLEADWRARAAALEADMAMRLAARPGALLAAFASADLGPAPKPARCDPSELLLRLRSQRRRAGDAEFELHQSRFRVCLADLAGASLTVFAHTAKGDGEAPGTETRLLVRLSVKQDDWPRWAQWESPISIRDGRPDGYAISGEPEFVAAVAPLLEHVGAWQVTYLPGYRLRVAQREAAEHERLEREAAQRAAEEERHREWMERVRAEHEADVEADRITREARDAAMPGLLARL